MQIKMGRHANYSTAERDTLTHVAAELGIVVNATVTPRPGAESDKHPVAHIHIHYGDKRGGGLGMTTTDADALMDAGMALLRAGQMLRQDQAAYEGVKQ